MQQSRKQKPKKSEILTSHYSSIGSGKVHSNKSNSEKSVKNPELGLGRRVERRTDSE